MRNGVRSDAVTLKFPLRFGWVFLVGIVWLVAGSLMYHSRWLRHSPPVRSAVEAGYVLVLILGCVRALRAGLRMDRDGVTVRNFWWTYKVSWPQVSHLGHAEVGGDHLRDSTNVLAVMLRDGRTRPISTAPSSRGPT